MRQLIKRITFNKVCKTGQREENWDLVIPGGFEFGLTLSFLAAKTRERKNSSFIRKNHLKNK